MNSNHNLTYKLLPIALAVVCATSSCSDIDNPGIIEGSKTTIYATIADSAPTTRTSIDTEHAGNGYLGVMWQSGDKIGVYSVGATRNACFTSTAAGKTVEFTGSMNGGEQPKYAYYPYSADNAGKEPTALCGMLPEDQPYGADGALTADYKYGEPASGTTNYFVFEHLFSMLHITVDATGTSLEGEKLESVAVTVKDSEGHARTVNGSFTFNALDGSWQRKRGHRHSAPQDDRASDSRCRH